MRWVTGQQRLPFEDCVQQAREQDFKPWIEYAKTLRAELNRQRQLQL
jgi:hypothetical protein